ncbi:MAG: hypothetical protein ACFCUP_00480 [Actinomycetales bacterium]
MRAGDRPDLQQRHGDDTDEAEDQEDEQRAARRVTQRDGACWGGGTARATTR